MVPIQHEFARLSRTDQRLILPNNNAASFYRASTTHGRRVYSISKVHTVVCLQTSHMSVQFSVTISFWLAHFIL